MLAAALSAGCVTTYYRVDPTTRRRVEDRTCRPERDGDCVAVREVSPVTGPAVIVFSLIGAFIYSAVTAGGAS